MMNLFIFVLSFSSSIIPAADPVEIATIFGAFNNSQLELVGDIALTVTSVRSTEATGTKKFSASGIVGLGGLSDVEQYNCKTMGTGTIYTTPKVTVTGNSGYLGAITKLSLKCSHIKRPKHVQARNDIEILMPVRQEGRPPYIYLRTRPCTEPQSIGHMQGILTIKMHDQSYPDEIEVSTFEPRTSCAISS
jgi:hypothetical protein